MFWASSIEQLEELVLQLLAEPERLQAIPVAPTPQGRGPQGEQAYHD